MIKNTGAKIKPGDIVTLVDDEGFRGKVVGISSGGNVFCTVIKWSQQSSGQGYRSRTGILDSARFPKARLIVVKTEEV